MSFGVGKRVHVMFTSDGVVVDAPGVVSRVCISNPDAWVTLDERHANAAVHPFGVEEGARGRKVRVYWDDVRPVDKGRAK
jgi:hypothetical protein